MNALDPAPPLAAPVTICALCYGHHPDLAERLLTSLWRHTTPESFQLRIAANAPSAATLRVFDRLLPRLSPRHVVVSEENLYKAPMMRRLLYDQPIETPWTLWFDDDSFVYRSDWLFMLECRSRQDPRVDMWGRKLFIRAGEAHRHFISEAPWYRNRDLSPDGRPGCYRLDFIGGGFWAIRTRWLTELNWPDPRLVHFGDDYMLGEALRQQGASIGNAFSGVAIGQAVRRAPANTPRTEALT